MSAESTTDNPVRKLSRLTEQIANELGVPLATTRSPVGFEHLNSDGAWKYQFQKAPQWGLVAAGPETSVETAYPGWGTVVVEPGHWAVFYDHDFAGIVSPHGGRIGGYATVSREEHVTELEEVMIAAFTVEHESLVSGPESRERERNTA